MQKNPITDIIQVEENKPKKQKKNKHPTACVDKTRFGCGICGSQNFVYFGVCGCEECNDEKEFIVSSDWKWLSHDGYWESNWKCDHKSYYDRQTKSWKPKYRIVIEACVDCGAIRSTYCPNCRRRMWIDKFGIKKNCQTCGYREG